MATRRTWVWVVVAVASGLVVCLIAVAGAGVYFVSRRVQALPSSPVDAQRSFEQVTASFGSRRALYELNMSHEPQLAMPFASLPTAETRATDLWVQAWDPEDERLVRLSLPLWLLRFGDQRMRVIKDEGGIALKELTLDFDQLGRIGSTIVLDYRRPDGLRILLWTK